MVEILVCVLIVAIVGIATITTLLVARELAEYDKQRIAAISSARYYLEEQARRNIFPTITPATNVSLDNFNTPTQLDDLHATVAINLYQVNADGTRGAQLTAAPTTPARIEVDAVVTWNRTGRLSSRQVTETLQTYVSPNL